MFDKEQYRSAFSQVHTTVKVEMEDLIKMKPIHRARKRMVMLAAVVCLILAFSITAYAMNLFGLKDIVLKSDTNDVITIDYGKNTADDPNGTVDTPRPQALISLQGLSDSNEYKAVAEWTSFTNSYDKDGAILAKVGNGPTGLDDKYSLYLVYSQEMADKLDEIVSKYGLSLHRTLDVDLTEPDLYSRLGTSDFLGAINKAYSIYINEDGTFHIDGAANVSSGKEIGYQIMNCKKGSFTDVLLNISDAAAYDEWTYKTASGVTVLLSLGPDKALVLADLNSSFFTINVLAGTVSDPTTVTPSDLEEIADSIDFSALN